MAADELPLAVASVSLVGDTLWALLCSTTTSVVAIDVRNPDEPTSVGPPTQLEGTERPVMADGRLAIGLGQDRGIEVFDLSAAPRPRLMARLAGPGTVLGLWNGLVYVARAGRVDVYRIPGGATVQDSGPPPIATYAARDFVPTAWNPGWVDGDGRVVLNRWGNGWTVLATLPVPMRPQAHLPVAFRP